MMLDVMPACPDLAVLAGRAAGDGDCYAGASDDELAGVLCAWDRLEAHMAARKLAAIAELARQCDYEHSTPYQAGGRTCLCNADPKCRRDHKLKQHPRWKVERHPDGTVTWTTPSGRTYTTEPTRYPI